MRESTSANRNSNIPLKSVDGRVLLTSEEQVVRRIGHFWQVNQPTLENFNFILEYGGCIYALYMLLISLALEAGHEQWQAISLEWICNWLCLVGKPLVDKDVTVFLPERLNDAKCQSQLDLQSPCYPLQAIHRYSQRMDFLYFLRPSLMT